MIRPIHLFILVILITTACRPRTAADATQTSQGETLQYARGFRISPIEGGKLLRIVDPGDSLRVMATLALMDDDTPPPTGVTAVKVPCRRIACLSSTYMAYLIELDAVDGVVAINSSRHLMNAKVNALIQDGRIQKVGKEGNFNTEALLALAPDVVLVSPFKTGGYEALQQLNLPLVPMMAYEEEHPLGRAEWLKMMGCLVGKKPLADSLFANIAQQYDHLKQLAATAPHRPSVFSGKMKSGTWYVPGGRSFYAHYFRDAGARYIFEQDTTRGASAVDFEIVYQRAAKADFWRIYSNTPGDLTREQLAAEDARYGHFNAFEKGNVLYCNIAEKAYYEQGPVKPHVMLADYIHFFHPELLPAHEPVYYQRIQE